MCDTSTKSSASFLAISQTVFRKRLGSADASYTVYFRRCTVGVLLFHHVLAPVREASQAARAAKAPTWAVLESSFFWYLHSPMPGVTIVFTVAFAAQQQQTHMKWLKKSETHLTTLRQRSGRQEQNHESSRFSCKARLATSECHFGPNVLLHNHIKPCNKS